MIVPLAFYITILKLFSRCSIHIFRCPVLNLANIIHHWFQASTGNAAAYCHDLTSGYIALNICHDSVIFVIFGMNTGITCILLLSDNTVAVGPCLFNGFHFIHRHPLYVMDFLLSAIWDAADSSYSSAVSKLEA